MTYPKIQADRPVDSKLSSKEIHALLETVFTAIMPLYGFKIRDEQIKLAEHILKSLERYGISFAEGGVGIGKTLAYILVATLVKRGRINDFHSLGLYPEMQYADMTKMPIVIATSSIALQQAILTEYIPKISKILVKAGIITKPITAVLRKGKDNYICMNNLKTYMSIVPDQKERQKLEIVLRGKYYDFAKLDSIELAPKTRQSIAVDGRCFKTCPHRRNCQYHKFREEVQVYGIDFQIVNHHLLLADTRHRADGLPLLIPNYQMLIVDEAHKFLAAARSIYGIELTSEIAVEIRDKIADLYFKRGALQPPARRKAKQLVEQNKTLFKMLADTARSAESGEDEPDHFGKSIELNADTALHMQRIHKQADELLSLMHSEVLYTKAQELLAWIAGRYAADVSGIKLDTLLPVVGIDDDVRKKQVNALCEAIYALPEIKHRVKFEQSRRVTSYRFSDAEWTPKVYKAIRHWAQKLLQPETVLGDKSEWLIRLMRQISHYRDTVADFNEHGNLIGWYETDNDEGKLCAIPKNLDKLLFKEQWSKKIPTVLTSGTLSAEGDFTHVKKALGLNYLNSRFLSETTHPSPFDYKKNALLYIQRKRAVPQHQERSVH